jgi:hypothetical protein
MGNAKEKRRNLFRSMKTEAAIDTMFERNVRWCLLVGLVGIVVLAFW